MSTERESNVVPLRPGSRHPQVSLERIPRRWRVQIAMMVFFIACTAPFRAVRHVWRAQKQAGMCYGDILHVRYQFHVEIKTSNVERRHPFWLPFEFFKVTP